VVHSLGWSTRLWTTLGRFPGCVVDQGDRPGQTLGALIVAEALQVSILLLHREVRDWNHDQRSGRY